MTKCFKTQAEKPESQGGGKKVPTKTMSIYIYFEEECYPKFPQMKKSEGLRSAATCMTYTNNTLGACNDVKELVVN